MPQIAAERGAYVVEINPEETPLTARVDEFLQGKPGAVLPALINRIQQGLS